ncbi:hypothetical protein [Celerinatantimonas diazotrophica]|uniref:Uncharacterized protein n=1 Tax=Celerinatantimonas diazotrophica TaxID=412034 RepID=A0A4R1KGT5_9GAMM|nr:hypothetical protein [Celerinatantimonas diazotrophica]TCK63965.1 hypothetical protein EV690_0079 [Celerinatantimonas diazotrophica]CAG9297050.1 hypothetical protein CEDIAZO_02212 [Celerinatantimonas diazotrophica]
MPDYEQTLQEAALNFMCRHQAEYQHEDLLLFQSTIMFLRNTISAEQQLATRIVARAYREFSSCSKKPGYWLDRANSTANVAIIVDPDGVSHAIGLPLIVRQFIESPPKPRLLVVK